MSFELPLYFYNGVLLDTVGFILGVCLFLPLLLLNYWIISEIEELRNNESDGDKDTSGSFQVPKDEKNPKNLKKFQSKEIKDDVYNEALRMMDKAQVDSLRILKEAQIKAQDLLDNTYTVSKENREKLRENVRKIYEKQSQVLGELSEELLESYKAVVEEGKKENIRTLYEITEAMKQEAIKGVDELKNVVKKETIGAQDALEEKIAREYAKVDDEIKEYKKKKVNSLNKKVYELLSNIYTEVIGQDLDQVKHEKLIIELLEKELSKSGLKNNS